MIIIHSHYSYSYSIASKENVNLTSKESFFWEGGGGSAGGWIGEIFKIKIVIYYDNTMITLILHLTSFVFFFKFNFVIDCSGYSLCLE